jgi:tetratricopeptide (TPR) repeat protein
MRLFLCGVSAAIFTAAPAAAANGDFYACDGYVAPGKKSDGITTGAWLFGLATGNTEYRRGAALSVGSPGVGACDTALADPLLEPRYWLRRANLLQAKALHLIAMEKDEEALAVLRQSDSAAPAGEALFGGSIGFGNRALRAISLYRLNRIDEARAELSAIERGRPDANSLRALARTVRLLFEGDSDSYFRVLGKEAGYDPNLLELIFRASILYGRFDAAAAVYGQISDDLPRNHGSFVIQGLEAQGYERIAERADLAGAMGYVLIAQGKAEAGRALIAKARRDLAGASTPPVPTGGRIRGSVQRDYDRRLAAATKGGGDLDGWEQAIALREAAPTLGLTELSERTRTSLPQNAPVVLDLISQAKASAEERRAATAEVTQAIDQARRHATVLDYAQIAKMLPRPETAGTKPSFRRAGDGIILDNNQGFYARKHDDSEALTVGYASNLAPPAMVEELAMLAAAMKTREAGKDGFVIESRLLIQRSITSGYGPAQSGVPSGYDVRLRILPVSRAALPAGLEAGRVIDAVEVHRRLYPKYTAPPAAAAN